LVCIFQLTKSSPAIYINSQSGGLKALETYMLLELKNVRKSSFQFKS